MDRLEKQAVRYLQLEDQRTFAEGKFVNAKAYFNLIVAASCYV